METLELERVGQVKIPPQKSLVVKNKAEISLLKFNILRQFFSIKLKKSRSLIVSIKFLKKVKDKYQKVFAEPLMSKVVKVDGKYYWGLMTPGYPSLTFKKVQEHEIDRFLPGQPRKGLRLLFLAITNKCPLNCEHCFEWPNLNKNKSVSEGELIELIHKYQDFGTTLIMLSGGEPMLRVNTIYKILKAKKEGTDFWIVTSGLGFNIERARKLKSYGLTGVMVSLDHYDRQKHNQFRGFPDAYNNALQAVINANKMGIVTTLSLCATKEFITRQYFTSYMELAKSLGVAFVQIFESSAAGRYADKNVSLSADQIQILETAYHDYNSLDKYQDYPIINYPGYNQRRLGCFGGGDRFFYIDTDGDAHVCPVCTKKVGSAIDNSPDEIIKLLSKSSCGNFNSNQLL